MPVCGWSWTRSLRSSSGGTSLLGGRFSIHRLRWSGAMIIQAVNTGILLSGFPPEFNLIIKAAIVVIILIIQSPAHAGRRSDLQPQAESQSGAAEMNSEIPAAPGDHRHLRRFLRGLRGCSTRTCFPRASTGNLLTDNAFLGNRRRRHDLRHPGGRYRPVDRLGHRLHRRVSSPSCWRAPSIHPLAAFAFWSSPSPLPFGATDGRGHPLSEDAGLHRTRSPGMFLGARHVLRAVDRRHPHQASRLLFGTLTGIYYYSLPGGGRLHAWSAE